jgi:putative serine/threonine protein kinase
MDKAGLDHGELSRAPKHILVDSEGKPHIIDFGKSSFKRRVSNVTSISQFLFIRGKLARKIKKILGKINRKRLIEALKNYKQKMDDESFKKILLVLGLTKLNH